MAQTLQYKTTAQRARIQTSSAGIHHPVAGKANHELTFKPDQLGGADQRGTGSERRSERRLGRRGTTETPGALHSPPVASSEPRRLLSSTPFKSSSGECRL
jgi:hypothetical protein